MKWRGEKSSTHLWGGSPSRWWLTGPRWGIWVRRTEYITGTAAGSRKSVWTFTWALERENKRSGKAPWGERGHLLFQLGLGQQLWDEVQTDVDGGDSCHSERKQGLRVTLGDKREQGQNGTLVMTLVSINNVQYTLYVHHKYQKFLRHLKHKNMEGVCLCVNEKDWKKGRRQKSVPNHPGAASAAF